MYCAEFQGRATVKIKHIILAITVPVVAILDQLTKMWANSALKPLAEEAEARNRFVTVIDGFFRFRYAENTGAAWSLFRDTSASFRVPFFIIVTLLAIGFIFWFYRRLEPKQRLLALAVSLLLGGAVGNLIDRIRFGYVVDFVDWYVSFSGKLNLGLFTIEAGEKHWPTFNVADAAITVGIVLLMVEMLFLQKKRS
jgi:signal peptidase II